MQPVEVNGSPLPDQLWAAFRQLAAVLSAFAIGRGWITDETATLLIAIAGILWPVIYGQLKVRGRATLLAQVAVDPTVTQVTLK